MFLTWSTMQSSTVLSAIASVFNVISFKKSENYLKIPVKPEYDFATIPKIFSKNKKVEKNP